MIGANNTNILDFYPIKCMDYRPLKTSYSTIAYSRGLSTSTEVVDKEGEVSVEHSSNAESDNDEEEEESVGELFCNEDNGTPSNKEENDIVWKDLDDQP
ncbi:hypothetical protein Tco_1187278, partial [Tanacetum coccineum]